MKRPVVTRVQGGPPTRSRNLEEHIFLRPPFCTDASWRRSSAGAAPAYGCGGRCFAARTSGVPLEQEFAQLVTLREGLVTHDEVWFQWDEGLRAAGLDPDAFAFPEGGKPEQATSSSS